MIAITSFTQQMGSDQVEQHDAAGILGTSRKPGENSGQYVPFPFP
jgi:hypothetical protein